ncbi:hypothetical protein K503DRAFT_522278 [Rhizopogon vinicolor AM-OR11-026]|uniref:Uncharacterized protein n=1 Tax=Rhizopogon vinicolor AM-OR11-026 TaxID=1314800 RepID=A0A1B7MLG9_9AGAM|nr:hypothetical protein K503DRAFT_522278 [Rhizopogon vinicolor AM-OR11-026]
MVYPERRHDCRVRVRTSRQRLCSTWHLFLRTSQCSRRAPAGSSLPSSAFLFSLQLLSILLLFLCLLSMALSSSPPS